MSFNKILVGYDGSEHAQMAAGIGAEIACKYGSELILLAVFNPASLYAIGAFTPGAVITPHRIEKAAKEWQDAMKRQARETQAAKGASMRFLREVGNPSEREAQTIVEQPAEKLFTASEVAYQWQFEVGHPVATITKVAAEQKADLIILGSRGLGGFKRLLLGSVSDGVLHHAHCSVLIVRGENAPDKTNEFQHILLVSDGSEGAGKAARTAVEVADKFATSLTVLNVVEPFATLPFVEGEEVEWPTKLDPDTVASRMLDRLQDSVRKVANEVGVYCSFHQEKGQAAEVILRFADQHHADLLVMGSRGLGGFERLMLGSVSNYVAHHSSCPILIVR